MSADQSGRSPSGVVMNEREGRCLHECRVTWNGEHGGSLPGGPFPGTSGKPGDLRVCEHGRVWRYAETFTNRFYCQMDRWTRVSRLSRAHRKVMRLTTSASSPSSAPVTAPAQNDPSAGST